MEVLAQAVGVLAVVTFIFSYQQKKKKTIIALNAISRTLYIIQYVMLGAFEGAVLDVLGIISSCLAQNKEKPIVYKHFKMFVIIINLIILTVGLLLYKNIYSLFPVAGVILHTSAFWINKESTIRKVSFLGSPFWLIYNLVNRAYGSATGDILTMISIAVAICRYDLIVSDKNNKVDIGED